MITLPLYDDNIVKLDERSLHVGGSWTKDGVYDGALLEFLAGKMLQVNNPTLVDVGASTGSFALLPKFVGGESIAFEPHPEIFKILCKNVQLNDLSSRVKLFNLAMSAYDGPAYLRIPRQKSQSGLSTLGKPKGFSKFNKLKVVCRKLDSMRLGRVDFLKVDTEGCELFVLNGARMLLHSDHPMLLIEHSERNASQFEKSPEQVIEYLRDFGYSNFEMIGREDLWVT
jgi:FkbM family methyltransferase